MSVSLVLAQTTIALRNVLQTALRLDAGWRETGGEPRITTLPHGKPDKGSGERVNLALVSVAPSRHLRNEASAPPGGDAPLLLDLRYLVSVHVLYPLHAELMIGAALEALLDSPVLGQPALTDDDPLEVAINEAAAPMSVTPPRISVEAAEARSFDVLRVPALLIHVSPVIVTLRRGATSLLIDR